MLKIMLQYKKDKKEIITYQITYQLKQYFHFNLIGKTLNIFNTVYATEK